MSCRDALITILKRVVPKHTICDYLRMDPELATASFGQDESIFDRAWSYMLNHYAKKDIIHLLHAIELQLQLPRGFLTQDSIIQQKMSTLTPTQNHSKKEFLLLVMHVLSEIKVVDLHQGTVYGDFGDDHRVYEDNHNNLLYRRNTGLVYGQKNGAYHVLLQESPTMSLIRSGSPFAYDSDTDDTSSIMDAIPQDRTSSIWSGDDFEAFNLQRMLEDLNNHHYSIHLSFQTIGTKLEKLKIQNSHDLAFLNRLCANNEVIREKMNDMRYEISDLLKSIEEMKSCGRDSTGTEIVRETEAESVETDEQASQVIGKDFILTADTKVCPTLTTHELSHAVLTSGSGATAASKTRVPQITFNTLHFVWPVLLLVTAVIIREWLHRGHENII